MPAEPIGLPGTSRPRVSGFSAIRRVIARGGMTFDRCGRRSFAVWQEGISAGTQNEFFLVHLMTPNAKITRFCGSTRLCVAKLISKVV